jgi:hypothetical protein
LHEHATHDGNADKRNLSEEEKKRESEQQLIFLAQISSTEYFFVLLRVPSIRTYAFPEPSYPECGGER